MSVICTGSSTWRRIKCWKSCDDVGVDEKGRERRGGDAARWNDMRRLGIYGGFCDSMFHEMGGINGRGRS